MLEKKIKTDICVTAYPAPNKRERSYVPDSYKTGSLFQTIPVLRKKDLRYRWNLYALNTDDEAVNNN